MNNTQQHIIDNDITPEIGNRVSLTQINDRDRAHLRTFPAYRRAQVMKQISSLAPARVVVYQGKNEYEKAIFSLHRDRYRLMHMQAEKFHLNAYWYRKARTFLVRGADVVMLLWEHGGDGRDGGTTTLTSWRIE